MIICKRGGLHIIKLSNFCMQKSLQITNSKITLLSIILTTHCHPMLHSNSDQSLGETFGLLSISEIGLTRKSDPSIELDHDGSLIKCLQQDHIPSQPDEYCLRQAATLAFSKKNSQTGQIKGSLASQTKRYSSLNPDGRVLKFNPNLAKKKRKSNPVWVKNEKEEMEKMPQETVHFSRQCTLYKNQSFLFQEETHPTTTTRESYLLSKVEPTFRKKTSTENDKKSKGMKEARKVMICSLLLKPIIRTGLSQTQIHLGCRSKQSINEQHLYQQPSDSIKTEINDFCQLTAPERPHLSRIGQDRRGEEPIFSAYRVFDQKQSSGVSVRTVDSPFSRASSRDKNSHHSMDGQTDRIGSEYMFSFHRPSK